MSFKQLVTISQPSYLYVDAPDKFFPFSIVATSLPSIEGEDTTVEFDDSLTCQASTEPFGGFSKNGGVLIAMALFIVILSGMVVFLTWKLAQHRKKRIML